jgi:DnaJ-class molecular chaperone
MSGMRLCKLCQGHGSHAVFDRDGLQYWPCSACHGAGVLALGGPPMFQVRGLREWLRRTEDIGRAG